jgi:large subunit ribosomal protein L20
MSFNKDRILEMAKGFTGRNKNVYRAAVPRVEKALQYAYVGRKLKKRDARAEWIAQINSATREYNIKYNAFMHGLVSSNVMLNRKMLSELVC